MNSDRELLQRIRQELLKPTPDIQALQDALEKQLASPDVQQALERVPEDPKVGFESEDEVKPI